MKKLVLLLTVCLLFGLKGYSQFAFGVAPGLSTNTAYFGFKAGKVVPYIGFQYANVKFKMVQSGVEWTGTEQEDYENEIKVSGNMYVPNLGVKFFAIEHNKLKAYFNLSIAKPIIRAKVTEDGDDVEDFYHNGEYGNINEILKDVKLLGGEFGFGVEYFFDDNFSLGGEFGLRYFGGSYSDKWEEDVYNGSDYDEEDFESKIRIGLMPTYSKITLNFYFGGKGE
ncbi:MAG: hypothetical protein JXA72_04215 [Bacteroidales bacterium]|nr:hypothetical protein [Bacteroidales bacterium]